MTAKASHSGLQWFSYIVGRTMAALMLALPWRTARAVARVMGEISYLLDRPARKKDALASLRRVFPSFDAAQARRTLRGVYRHLSESIIDSLNFVRFAPRRDLDELLDVVGLEKLKALPQGSGVVFVTGHFGHWEVMGAAAPLVGYPLWSVGRSSGNYYMDSFIKKLREATGQHVLEKKGALLPIIRILRRGENVAILIDQDARRDGIFVDFLGRPASTTATPARLAIRTGAPLAFVYTRRMGDLNRFRVVVKNVIRAEPTNDEEAEARRITQQLNRELEEVIREAPEEWFWLHRRWKTYPGKYDKPRGGAGD